MRISLLNDQRDRLGESPVWDHRRNLLWWTDSIQGRIFAAGEDGAVQRDWRFDTVVGSIGLAEAGLVAAFTDDIVLIDDAGEVKRLGALAECASTRLNDGKMDRQGRFVVGSLQTVDGPEPLASLWRVDGAGLAERIEQGLRLANATCFSPDGRWLYFADSLEQIIRRYPYDPRTGAVGERQDFIDCKAIDAFPDGATVDAQGRLWVALVTTGALACFSPEGTLVERIALPTPYPSCPAFGGPDLDRLYVTSISDSGHRLKSDHPNAGAVVVIEDMGATGIPEAVFRPDNHNRN